LDPNFITAHNVLGGSFVYKSMYNEGIPEFKKSLAISPGDERTLGFLGLAYAQSGRRAAAQNVLDQLNQLSKKEYVEPVPTAQIYTALGEKDKAFEWLEKAYEERSWYLGFVKVDRPFDPLRSDPRFADLLRRMNLEP
jgi:tetratricopeptide (TPR) repeat protein